MDEYLIFHKMSGVVDIESVITRCVQAKHGEHNQYGPTTVINHIIYFSHQRKLKL